MIADIIAEQTNEMKEKHPLKAGIIKGISDSIFIVGSATMILATTVVVLNKAIK